MTINLRHGVRMLGVTVFVCTLFVGMLFVPAPKPSDAAEYIIELRGTYPDYQVRYCAEWKLLGKIHKTCTPWMNGEPQ